MIKTGSQHVATLKDGRQVFINGELSGDVTAHPAFRRSIASIGTLYDFQSRPENGELMTFETSDGAGRANRIWQLPRNYRADRPAQGARSLDRASWWLSGPRARSRRVLHFRHVHGPRRLRSL